MTPLTNVIIGFFFSFYYLYYQKMIGGPNWNRNVKGHKINVWICTSLEACLYQLYIFWIRSPQMIWQISFFLTILYYTNLNSSWIFLNNVLLIQLKWKDIGTERAWSRRYIHSRGMCHQDHRSNYTWFLFLFCSEYLISYDQDIYQMTGSP